MNKSARLQWALIHKICNIVDWSSVILPDEVKIYRLNSAGIRHDGSRYPKKYPAEVVEALKFGSANVIIWDCLSWFGAGKMRRVSSRIDSNRLVNIQDTRLVTTIYEVVSKLFSNARNHVVFKNTTIQNIL